MDQNYIQTQIDKLKSLRDDRIDGIPSGCSWSDMYYKGTSGWFQALYGRLSILRKEGLLCTDLDEHSREFQQNFSQRPLEIDKQKGVIAPINREDIDFGNKLISDIIDSLEEILHSFKN